MKTVKSIASRLIFKMAESARSEMENERRRELLDRLSSSGHLVLLGRNSIISDPEFCSIGNNVKIGEDCYIMSEGGLQIHDNVRISRRVTIYCSDHRFQGKGTPLPFGPYRNWKQVVIERNAWIGMNACILPGVRIGEGSIIGMGAVVAKDVPPLTIVGLPAWRELGHRNLEEYQSAESSGDYSGKSGRPLPPNYHSNYRSNGLETTAKLAFVLSSSRSESKRIAEFLRGRYESRLQVQGWAAAYLRGDISEEALRDQLAELYLKGTVYGEEVRIEVDRALLPLAPLLSRALPQSRFLLLMRESPSSDPEENIGIHPTPSEGEKMTFKTYWKDNLPNSKPNEWYYRQLHEVRQLLPEERTIVMTEHEIFGRKEEVLKFLRKE